MDKTKRKSILMYMALLVIFFIFSMYIFIPNNKKSNVINNSNTKVENNIDASSNNVSISNENNEETIYEKESKDIVEKFLTLYHEISEKDPLSQFESAKDIVSDALYEELKNEVIGNNIMNNNGLVYRTIEELNIYGYEFDDDSKTISLKAKVYSNWLDKSNKVSIENELTEYDFMLINDMGNWKISQLYSIVI